MSEEHDAADARDAPEHDAAETRNARLMQISSLREIKKLGVSWDEANSHRIGKNVAAIAENGEGTFKALAHTIWKKWTEEKALKKRRLNEPLKSPQQNEEKQPSGSQG